MSTLIASSISGLEASGVPKNEVRLLSHCHSAVNGSVKQGLLVCS